MKAPYSQLLITLFSLPLFSYAQRDSTFFIDEITVHLNRTIYLSSGDYINPGNFGKFGFGAGVYHSFRKNKRMELITGVEYNQTNLFREVYFEDSVTHLSNVKYNLNCISLPFKARFSTGKKMKLFFETGLFIDFYCLASEVGERVTKTVVGGVNTYTSSDYSNISVFPAVNFGPQSGIGMTIPVKENAILIMADYKFGVLPLYKNNVYKYNAVYNRYLRFIVGFKL